jgi:hypothetical protein
LGRATTYPERCSEELRVFSLRSSVSIPASIESFRLIHSTTPRFLPVMKFRMETNACNGRRWGLVLLITASLALHASAETLKGGALAGERPRIIVSTDIGGSDPDDVQSLVHYLLYADVFETEGIISSPPGKGRTSDIQRVLDAYAADFTALRERSPEYPDPADLRAGVKQGALEAAPAAGISVSTEGSRWIVARARAASDRPLWVLAWGSLADVAQAVHDAPDIKPRLRLYSIGSWNTAQDPAARAYLFDHHPDLWWIENDTTFRGMYLGGDQAGDLDNGRFVEQHVRSHGALGACFWAAKREIKMGDTPSVLYLLRGTPSDPTRPSWGGRFIAPLPERPAYWHDDPNPRHRFGDRDGAEQVNRWRTAYLRDWQQRLEALPSRHEHGVPPERLHQAITP